MATSTTSRIAQESLSQPTLSLAFDLGKNTWTFGFTLGMAQPPRARTSPAGALATFQPEIPRAKQRFGWPEAARVGSCSEAGRDGFWRHRSLVAPGVQNHGIDAARLAVTRRQRRAKTARLAVRTLLTRLRRHSAGEKTGWSVVRVPRVEEEDRRQLQRALTRANQDRTRVSTRLPGWWAGPGVPLPVQGEVDAQLAQVPHGEGSPRPAARRTRLKRAWPQVGLLTAPIETLEAERRALWRRREDPGLAPVRQRFTRRGSGVQSAGRSVMAGFAGRAFQTPKPGGALAGLPPTPSPSGQSRQERGIATAGPRQRRARASELAWAWRRFPPARALSQWDERRCGAGSARWRQLGMVARARQLWLALWRCFKTGVLPEGAVR